MKGDFKISCDEQNSRLDMVFNNHFKDFSRSHIKNLIGEGKILLNGKTVKSGEKVKFNQIVSYDFEDLEPLQVQPENIDFEIVYQDKDLIVVNKPQGLVVHPCSSTKKGTLVCKILIKAVTKAKINPRINEIIANGIVYFIPADINSGKELITVCHIYFHLLFLCNVLKIKMLLVLSPTNSIHRFKYLITYIRLNIPSLA